MKEQWRKELQEKLADYRQTAPLLSWEEIEERITPALGQPKPRRGLANRWAAAAVALLVGGATVLLLHRNGEDLNAYQGASTSQMGLNAPQTEINHLPGGQIAAAEKTQRPNIESNIRTQTAIDEDAWAEVSVEETGANTAAITRTETTESAETSKNSTDNRGQTPPKRNAEAHVSPGNPFLSKYQQRGTASSLTAKVYVSGAMMASNGSNAVRHALGQANAIGVVYDSEMNEPADRELKNQSAQSSQEVHHRQPVRFGMSVRYALNRRWSVEGGLTYSRHYSEITKKSGQYASETQQTLHFIGIPLNANYRIWSNKRFQIYASAGAMGEKMVSGKTRTKARYADTSAENETTEKVKMPEIQLSVNAGIGAECQLDKVFSVYVEPGVSHHFKNGNNLATIYKDRPTNFNLNIGLRCSLR